MNFFRPCTNISFEFFALHIFFFDFLALREIFSTPLFLMVDPWNTTSPDKSNAECMVVARSYPTKIASDKWHGTVQSKGRNDNLNSAVEGRGDFPPLHILFSLAWCMEIYCVLFCSPSVDPGPSQDASGYPPQSQFSNGRPLDVYRALGPWQKASLVEATPLPPNTHIPIQNNSIDKWKTF